MKRLFIVASLAIMAIGCQKTEIQNLVTNEIGFNTEVSKLTRAITNGRTFDGTFGVVAYGHAETTTTVMNNVEIAKNSAGKWVAKPAEGQTEGQKYYWPNDEDTYLNFYAYSPYESNAVIDETNGYVVTVDVSAKPDYDLMVAAPVLKKKYDPATNGVVDLTFAHQMTQVIFSVTSSAPAGVTFDVTSIKFDNVVKSAEYTQLPTASWDLVNATYFTSTASCNLTLNETSKGNETTVPVTMIPQALTDRTFTVTYTISGTPGSGVANETVSKTLPLSYSIGGAETPTSVTSWVANKKITYNLTIGLNEISFNPVVTDWTPVDSSNDISIM